MPFLNAAPLPSGNADGWSFVFKNEGRYHEAVAIGKHVYEVLMLWPVGPNVRTERRTSATIANDCQKNHLSLN
jgi:hypothetical protein